MLVANAVTLRRATRLLLDGVSLRLVPGQVHALLGPNGAGKSSLLRVLSGELLPDAGEALLDNRPLQDLPALAQARRRAVLTQTDELRFAFRTEEMVALGLLPAPRLSTAQADAMVEQALRQADALKLRGRDYTSLSAGERARVRFAQVLAQLAAAECANGAACQRYLLLDEPTANFDIGHQLGCLSTARQLAAEGIGVLVVLHDINLAARHADVITLLCQGKLLGSGTPQSVLTDSTLAATFGDDLRFERVTALGRPQVFTELR